MVYTITRGFVHQLQDTTTRLARGIFTIQGSMARLDTLVASVVVGDMWRLLFSVTTMVAVFLVTTPRLLWTSRSLALAAARACGPPTPQ